MQESIITIKGLTEVKEVFDKTNKTIHKDSKRLLHNLGHFAKKELRSQIEEKGLIDLGELHKGIYFRTTARRGNIETVVRPSDKADKYAWFMEAGTRPHWAPRNALQGWADRHGIPVFLVQKSIAEKGTKPRHYLRDAMTVIEPEANKRISVFINNLLTLLSRAYDVFKIYRQRTIHCRCPCF